jgi:hypothetical protein
MDHPNCFKAVRSAATREADAILLIGTPLDFRLKYGRDDWNAGNRNAERETKTGHALRRNRFSDWRCDPSAASTCTAAMRSLPAEKYSRDRTQRSRPDNRGAFRGP